MNMTSDKVFILETAVQVYKSDAGICSKCGDIALSVGENELGLCNDCDVGPCHLCGLENGGELLFQNCGKMYCDAECYARPRDVFKEDVCFRCYDGEWNVKGKMNKPSRVRVPQLLIKAIPHRWPILQTTYPQTYLNILSFVKV